MLSAIQVVMSSITTLLPLGFDCTIADRYQNDTAHLRECGLGYVRLTRIFSVFSRWRFPGLPRNCWFIFDTALELPIKRNHSAQTLHHASNKMFRFPFLTAMVTRESPTIATQTSQTISLSTARVWMASLMAIAKWL